MVGWLGKWLVVLSRNWLIVVLDSGMLVVLCMYDKLFLGVISVFMLRFVVMNVFVFWV